MDAIPATNTVWTGWKLATNTGPPFWIHHVCRAITTPEDIIPYSMYMVVKISLDMSWLVCRWISKVVWSLTAYKIVKISSPDFICQWVGSLSVNAAIHRNWINPKKRVKDVSESLAGYFFNIGACIWAIETLLVVSFDSWTCTLMTLVNCFVTNLENHHSTSKKVEVSYSLLLTLC